MKTMYLEINMRFLALIAIILFSNAAIAEKPLEKMYEESKRNLFTEAGVAYDKQLSMYFEALPNISKLITDCINGSDGKKNVYGVFKFNKNKSTYQLLLTPESNFTRCMQDVFNGRTPPRPPQLPYLNQFKFTLEQ